MDGLSIGELARRAGLPAATLRSWESRYGFPRPGRQPGGHRRYAEADVAAVTAVLARRTAGLSLPAAISQVTRQEEAAEPSVFAGLRRRYPELIPQVLRPATLLALTRAMEDECCARAERATLFASFEQERFYRRSADRWAELARTGSLVVAFAGFAASRPGGPHQVAEVAVPPEAPLGREWALVCSARDYPACLAGWEIPGSPRRFEVVWSLDPVVVADAAAICTGLALAWDPELESRLAGRTPDPPPTASPDLRRATSLLTRMTGYLDGLS